MFYPAEGDYEWVELENDGDTTVNIQGYGITDEDGNWFRVPDALPEVPAGAFVVVVFDGQGSGSDDYDFGDNVATLHSPVGLLDVFENDVDQCAVYRYVPQLLFMPLLLNTNSPAVPRTLFDTLDNQHGTSVIADESAIVAFVAWGDTPEEDAANAMEAGIWDALWFVNLTKGGGFSDDYDVAIPGQPVGLIPESSSNSLDNWTLFSVSESTIGTENPIPGITWSNIAPGAAMESSSFAVAWAGVEGASEYRFQLSESSDFMSPMTDTVLSEPSISADERHPVWTILLAG